VRIVYNKYIRAEFSEYVQVHEEHNNTMKTRTTGAIATKPTGNSQGGHWFYSLTTGRMLDHIQWNPLPMPADVIDRIHALAKASPAGMHFTKMRNETYAQDDADDPDNESDDDSDYGSDDESSASDDDDCDDFIAGVDNNLPDPPDPPDVNANEIINNYDEEDDDVPEDNGADDATIDDGPNKDNDNESEIEANGEQAIVGPIPKKLKNLTNETGALYPIIESRTRQQAQADGKSLVTMQTITTTEQRRLRRELLTRLLKKHEEDNKKTLRNKLKKKGTKDQTPGKEERQGNAFTPVS
jgi:hypothetical protein